MSAGWRRGAEHAELAVLGAIMLAAGSAEEGAGMRELAKVSSAGLESAHFYSPQAQACFRAMQRAAKTGLVDITTVLDAIQGSEDRELVSPDWLLELHSSRAGAQAGHYAGIVVEHAKRRTLHDHAAETAERIANGEDESAEDERARLASKLNALGATDTAGVSSAEAVRVAFEGFFERARQTRQPGTPLGIPTLTNIHGGGFQRKCVYTFGARPGVGKSAIGLQFANHSAVELGVPWQVHTLEMSISKCIGRMTSQRSRVDAKYWGHGKDLAELEIRSMLRAGDEIGAAPITWREHTNADRILARIEAFGQDPRTWEKLAAANEARGGVGLVPCALVDHLHYATGKGPRESYLDFLTRFMLGAKQVAKRTGIAVVILAQLNRSSSTEHRPPTQADLRAAGAIEEGSDGITLLDRQPNGDNPEAAKAIVDKMRNGQCGRFDLRWDGPHQLFEDA